MAFASALLDGYAQQLEEVHEFAGALCRSWPDPTDRVVELYMRFFRTVQASDAHVQRHLKVTLFRLWCQSPFFAQYRALPRKAHTLARLVVFDKDGTLICLERIFAPWVEALVAGMAGLLPSSVDGQTVWQRLGYNPETKTFASTSIVPSGTYDDIRTVLCDYIAEGEGGRRSMEEVWDDVVAHWTVPELRPTEVTQCGALTHIFETLAARNVQVAVCTSDDRAPTLETLGHLGLAPAAVACGDDPLSFKPSPEPLWEICRRLGVPPAAAVMVGDTHADLNAALNAKFGHFVGVLTGGCTADDLAEADVVLDSVDGLLALPFLKGP